MIKYKKKILSNGLTVIAHLDKSTPMAAVNIIYKVGARNEDSNKTGFAHLFEHLMFGGSKNAPLFDGPIQMAAGENNAFTNNDYTNYYITIPKNNIETALWLESDRMKELNINSKSLLVQKKVVVEEFNQRYLNKIYGDTWLILRPVVYKEHPYRWATIGTSPDHIKNATLDDVRSFYNKFYVPSNAILCIAGDFEYEEIFELAQKWFSDIDKPKLTPPIIAKEPTQTQARFESVERDVPASLIYICYHIGGRSSREFTVCDTISDILSSGSSSRLYQSLVKQENIFSSVNCYVTGDIDPGLIVVTGSVLDGVDIDLAKQKLLEELEKIKTSPISDYELTKVKNKFEANTLFGEVNIMNKAMNLCFYDMLGDIDYINQELEEYKSVSSTEIMHVATQIFKPENSTTFYYKKSQK